MNLEPKNTLKEIIDIFSQLIKESDLSIKNPLTIIAGLVFISVIALTLLLSKGIEAVISLLALFAVLLGAFFLIHKYIKNGDSNESSSIIREAKNILSGEYEKEFGKIVEDSYLWEEATSWLINNKESLAQKSVNQFLSTTPTLTTAGHSLHSQKNQRDFTASISQHLEEIVNLLRKKSDRIEFTPKYSTTKEAYKDVYDLIIREIAHSFPDNNEITNILIGRIKILVSKLN